MKSIKNMNEDELLLEFLNRVSNSNKINDDLTTAINELAITYSEGSNELYKCLLELWKNGFETIGCCKGHDDSAQYIGFKRNDNDNIIKLLSLINKDDIIISFVNDKFGFRKKNKDIYDDIFDALEKLNNNTVFTINKEFENCIKFIDSNNFKYVNIHFYYLNNKFNKYLNTSDVRLINDLKEKYEYKILNEKLPMYHFIIK